MERSKDSDFIDTTTSGFNDASLATLDYLQYPHTEALGLSSNHPSPCLSLPSLDVAAPMAEYTHGSSYATSSSSRLSSSAHNTYPATLMSLCASELSSVSMSGSSSSRRSGSHSHNISSTTRSTRYNPLSVSSAASSGRERRHHSTEHGDFSDSDDEFAPATGLPDSNKARRRVICHECMGSKQRRRDEIRDGYRCLKGALPISNQKPTEVSLLNRATTHIKYLETTQQQFQTRLQQAENEISRLRQINRALILATAE